MLHLKLPTDPRWVDVATISIADILTDHAYCEQKAASSCISLIVEYAHLEDLVDTLTPVVSEEWSHFEMVLEQLRKRNLPLGKQRRDEYVVALQKQVRKGDVKHKLTDQLLVCALIEARSCERFKLLSQGVEDQELKKFYYDLMVSEARHYTNFISLARKYQAREIVDARWQEFLKMEAEIISQLTYRPNRIH
ncbi:tRNA-(ms[2]io[6]A)-hydroxylase [Hugenholtzia roseola]|uniref:tRNA-(ms[2]io[6]A)-hydroxylase n=1 Tax=Hugenholtzia roseola TaxID=1002 RepID=UPI000413AB71|nr:tRNA-(ms[2]io[6]A)-hydroxylase [Hugenholtzia roseola]